MPQEACSQPKIGGKIEVVGHCSAQNALKIVPSELLPRDITIWGMFSAQNRSGTEVVMSYGSSA